MSDKPNHQHNTNQDWEFSGFQFPTTTPVPDQVFDELLYQLSPTEIVVLLYIVRRTFGFKKRSDNISLKQLCEGITTKDGRVLDRGTGLSKATVIRALKNLEEKKVIKRTRQRSKKKGDEPTTYELNFIDPVFKNETGGVSELNTPVSHQRDTQQTVLQETVNNNVVVSALEKIKVEKGKAEELAAKYPAEYITEKLEYLTWKLETKGKGRPVSDPAAWLIRAIEKDYKPPDGFKTKAQRDSEDQERAEREAELERLSQEASEAREAERQRQLQALQDQYGTTQKELDLWDEILTEVRLSTTTANYQAWYTRTMLLSLNDGEAIVGVPNKATEEWLSHRQKRILEDAIMGVTEQQVEIGFVVLDGDSLSH